ncbi:MAG TPA: ATP-binding protein [Methanocorpusculum sp.]|nr:ATP-binding protein [Methanocorpusculum sp.]
MADGIQGKRIPLKVAESLVNSLNAGTTPRRGLEFITVGRVREIKILLNDLDLVRGGGSSCRFIIGEYGSGKSFMLQAVRNYALENDFVVMDVDLGPDKRFRGTGGKGLATYRALMASMATKTRPLGGALDSLLIKWLTRLQDEAGDGSAVQAAVTRKINDAVMQMETMMFAFDFAKVMDAYWAGVVNDDDTRKYNAARWFRGEYDGKREAKADLGVGTIITDDTWYAFLRLWAEFVTTIGYAGLIVFFDEAKTLANIASAAGRNANYEAILSIFNDTVQGRASHLAVLMGCTTRFIQDEKRGLFSYEALRSRLDDGRFGERNGMRNWDAPLMPLKVLSNEEIFALMQKLREIHGIRYNYTPRVTDADLEELLQATVNRVGAATNLTAREVTRNTMNILGILYHHPDAKFADIMHDHIEVPVFDEDEDFLLDD